MMGGVRFELAHYTHRPDPVGDRVIEVIPMQIQTLTFNDVLLAIAVIFLFVEIYTKIMGAIKTHREEKTRKEQPVNTLEQTVQQHEAKLEKDHERLNNLEESNRIMMRAMMALMSHELNGNSNDKLQASYEEIQQFLIDK